MAELLFGLNVDPRVDRTAMAFQLGRYHRQLVGDTEGGLTSGSVGGRKDTNGRSTCWLHEHAEGPGRCRSTGTRWWHSGWLATTSPNG
jgi:hypothetical protein